MAIPASPRCGCQGRGGAWHCRQGRPAGRNGLVALLDSYFARHRVAGSWSPTPTCIHGDIQ